VHRFDLSLVDRKYVKRTSEDVIDLINKILHYASKDFGDMSEIERIAVRYYMIAIAEVLSALVFHVVRRTLERESERAKPRVIFEALMFLRGWGIITEDELSETINIVKLKDLLLHRYWTVNDEKIYSSIKEDFTKVISAIKKICEFVGVSIEAP